MVGLPSQLGNQLVDDVCKKADKLKPKKDDKSKKADKLKPKEDDTAKNATKANLQKFAGSLNRLFLLSASTFAPTCFGITT